MTKNGKFSLQDDDVVDLETGHSGTSVKGWVNIGSHAVLLEMNVTGELKVEVHARTNESTPLAILNISKEISIQAGGKDPASFNRSHENEARYIYSSSWGHIFTGKREEITRWVFDRIKNNLIIAQVLQSSNWIDLDKYHKKDILESIFDNEAIDKPDAFGLEECETFPEWIKIESN